MESPRCIIDVVDTARSPDLFIEVLPDNIQPVAPSEVNLLNEGERESFWTISRMGRRRSQCEDTAVHATHDRRWHLYAVFDGHGGKAAADFCAETFAPRLFHNEDFIEGRPKEALRQAFLSTDDSFSSALGADESGSTAVVALVRDGSAFIAHVGDSRAVVSRSGVAEVLTEDHRATRDSEAERVESLGGFILMKRVQGVLIVSRAIGDCKYKEYVTAEPDIMEYKICREDEFLILASDGLWDVVSAQEAVNEVRRSSGELDLASERLMNMAQGLGSSDDVTISVVSLQQFHARSQSVTHPPRSPTCASANSNPSYCCWSPSSGSQPVYPL